MLGSPSKRKEAVSVSSQSLEPAALIHPSHCAHGETKAGGQSGMCPRSGCTKTRGLSHSFQNCSLNASCVPVTGDTAMNKSQGWPP